MDIYKAPFKRGDILYLAFTLKCHAESVVSYHFSHLTGRDKELLGL